MVGTSDLASWNGHWWCMKSLDLLTLDWTELHWITHYSNTVVTLVCKFCMMCFFPDHIFSYVCWAWHGGLWQTLRVYHLDSICDLPSRKRISALLTDKSMLLIWLEPKVFSMGDPQGRIMRLQAALNGLRYPCLIRVNSSQSLWLFEIEPEPAEKRWIKTWWLLMVVDGCSKF